MALTPSNMVALGTSAPSFRLPDPSQDNRLMSLDDFRGTPALLVMFICNHCPYVKHVADELARLGRDYQKKGVAVVAVNSNDAESYPDDSPKMMIRERVARGYSFPYLYDETQETARAYDAACTPDFYVFDRDRKLSYRGQLDDSRPGNGKPIDGSDLRAALDAVLEGRSVPGEQRPSIGCNIKWR